MRSFHFLLLLFHFCFCFPPISCRKQLLIVPLHHRHPQIPHRPQYPADPAGGGRMNDAIIAASAPALAAASATDKSLIDGGDIQAIRSDRWLIEHVDYASASTHPPTEP